MPHNPIKVARARFIQVAVSRIQLCTNEMHNILFFSPQEIVEKTQDADLHESTIQQSEKLALKENVT